MRNEARNPGNGAALADGHGGIYSTAADATDVPLTGPRSAADNVTPSGNGMMAEVAFGRPRTLRRQTAVAQPAEFDMISLFMIKDIIIYKGKQNRNGSAMLAA